MNNTYDDVVRASKINGIYEESTSQHASEWFSSFDYINQEKIKRYISISENAVNKEMYDLENIGNCHHTNPKLLKHVLEVEYFKVCSKYVLSTNYVRILKRSMIKNSIEIFEVEENVKHRILELIDYHKDEVHITIKEEKEEKSNRLMYLSMALITFLILASYVIPSCISMFIEGKQ